MREQWSPVNFNRTRGVRRGGSRQENKLKVEKPQFPLDRADSRLHLVLERYVLRRMEAREHGVISEMELGRGVPTPRDEGARHSYSSFFS